MIHTLDVSLYSSTMTTVYMLIKINVRSTCTFWDLSRCSEWRSLPENYVKNKLFFSLCSTCTCIRENCIVLYICSPLGVQPVLLWKSEGTWRLVPSVQLPQNQPVVGGNCDKLMETLQGKYLLDSSSIFKLGSELDSRSTVDPEFSILGSNGQELVFWFKTDGSGGAWETMKGSLW